jgi:hypothetical protein
VHFAKPAEKMDYSPFAPQTSVLTVDTRAGPLLSGLITTLLECGLEAGFAWHRHLLVQLTTKPRHLSRIAWPLGRCRPPTLSAMGQHREKLGKNYLLTPSARSRRMGPE